MKIGGYKIESIIKEANNRRVLSCKKDGKHYAIKEFSKGNYHQYHHEIYIIKQLIQHQNIIKIEKIFQEGESKYIVLEWCYKDLKEFLNENLSLSQLDRLLLFAQIVSAFKAIQDDLQTSKLTFEHRDIKPDNLMLFQGNQLKIIDFGESRITDDTDDLYQEYHSTQICGTHGYMDPRMEYFNEGFQNKSDIWALGATLFFLMTNKELKIERRSLKIKVDVSQSTKEEIKKLRMDTVQQKINEYLEEITHENCKRLLTKMLNMDLDVRYDWEALFKDKFVDELWIILNMQNTEFRVGKRKQQIKAGEVFSTHMCSTVFYDNIGNEVTLLYKFIIRKGQLYLHTAQKMFQLFQYLKERVEDIQLNWQSFEKCNYLLHLKALYVFKVYSQMIEQKLQSLEKEHISDETFYGLKRLSQECFDRISLQIYYLFENVEKRLYIGGLESRIIQLQKRQSKEDETSEYHDALLINQEEMDYFPHPNFNQKINREKLSLNNLSSECFHQLFNKYLLLCLEVLLLNQKKILEKSELIIISNLITCYEVEKIPVGGDVPILNESDVINVTNEQIMDQQESKFDKIKAKQ